MNRFYKFLDDSKQLDRQLHISISVIQFLVGFISVIAAFSAIGSVDYVFELVYNVIFK